MQVPLTIEAKQKALYSAPLPAPELVALGDTYAGKGLWHDALEFYEGAQDRDRLGRTVQEAMDSADIVLYLNALRALGEVPSPEGLRDIKARALALGKEAVGKRVDLLMVPSE